MADNKKILTRDVEVSVIPAGDKVTLPEGTAVDITHRLGGNFTVVCDYGMFRVNGKDADALGEDIPETGNSDAKSPANEDGPLVRPTEEAVWEQLRTVYDPEIPVNIVDLGLVYSMEIMDSIPEVEMVTIHINEADEDAEDEPASQPGSGSSQQHDPATDGWHVEVKMTLTAPGCGMGPVIAEDAKTRVEALKGVGSAKVDIVWDPPWDQTMISEEGKMELGLI